MRKPSALAAMMTLLLGTSACAASAGSHAASSQTPVTETPIATLTLEPDVVYQTIAGFGTTGCWWAKDVGGWQQDKVGKVVDLLFDKKQGIGLTIYRFEVGGGGINNSADPWRRAETFEAEPGKYEWDRDANAVNVLRLAVHAGADSVMFFANTPPGRMTISGKTTGNDDGEPNLVPGMEGEFAKYLVDIALHFKSEGIPVKYISPINEPQWNWKESNGQEGCYYEPDQIVKVAQALVQELNCRSPELKPSLIDSGRWLDESYTVQLYKKLAEDPVVGPVMDHWAVHSYWSSDDDKRIAASLLLNTGVRVPLWQTEWCQMESGRDLGMDAALVLAQTVHEDMTIPNCSAWISWLAVSCYDYKDGLIYVDLDSKQVLDSKRLWALGNYSRFVLPGYKRIKLLGELEKLPVSAYISPDGQTAVLVVINAGSSEEKMRIAADGFASYEAYETSNAYSLDPVAKGKTGDYSFPAKSVTTLVLHK
jgi:O-glycosyl hydrolase